MAETIRYSLCPACDACPEVLLTDSGAVIGEGDNAVRLSKDEWNVLVEAIRRGDLGRLEVNED